MPTYTSFLSLYFHRKKLFLVICANTSLNFVYYDLCQHTSVFCDVSVMSMLLCVAACSLGASWNAHLVYYDVTAALCYCNLYLHLCSFSCIYDSEFMLCNQTWCSLQVCWLARYQRLTKHSIVIDGSWMSPLGCSGLPSAIGILIVAPLLTQTALSRPWLV